MNIKKQMTARILMSILEEHDPDSEIDIHVDKDGDKSLVILEPEYFECDEENEGEFIHFYNVSIDDENQDNYWIGDLCYVFSDTNWNEFIDYIKSNNFDLKNPPKEGFVLPKSNIRISFNNTAFGDGVYADKEENVYFVDAGLIGCINVKDITITDNLKFGNIHEFNKFPTLNYKNGVFKFTDDEKIVRINTK